MRLVRCYQMLTEFRSTPFQSLVVHLNFVLQNWTISTLHEQGIFSNSNPLAERGVSWNDQALTDMALVTPKMQFSLGWMQEACSVGKQIVA